jgi:hypothetical protein
VRLTYYNKEIKERQPSTTVKLYFNVPELPVRISLGFRMYKTKIFIPEPIQCFNCQQFGHMQSDCSKLRVCYKCGQQHENKEYTVDKPKCANCKGEHPSNSKTCPKKIEKILVMKKVYILGLEPIKMKPNYQNERFGIPSTGLTLPHVCACPKPGPGFPSYAVVFCMFSELR